MNEFSSKASGKGWGQVDQEIKNFLMEQLKETVEGLFL